MIFLKKLFDLAKILILTFVFSLVIDFFLGSKILKYFDTYFAKSQFYERLIRIDHPIYHHTLRENVKYTNNVSFIDTYELCTNNHGFKSKCNQITDKNYDFAFIGDSFTEGTPIEYGDSFVGIFDQKTQYKTANLGIVSYSPKIYLSKVNYLIQQGFNFNHIVVFIDISDLYDDTNFYSIDQNLKVTEKYSEKKNLKRRKFLRNNFPLTNFYMFVIKKYKFNNEERKEKSLNEKPIFTDKVNLKAKWTYSDEDKIEGYDVGVKEGNEIMVHHMEKLYEILSQNNIKLSLAVYPWPHQLENDVVNSIHVKIWQEFCENKCEEFINYFPIFFDEMNSSSYLETYKKYYFKNDPHFNKIGHKVLANKLIEILK